MINVKYTAPITLIKIVPVDGGIELHQVQCVEDEQAEYEAQGYARMTTYCLTVTPISRGRLSAFWQDLTAYPKRG